jgi:vitamin B12 transporter
MFFKSVINKKLLAFLTSLSIIPSVNAGQSSEEIETIIVSSNIEMPLREVATSVSVLDEKVIKEKGFLSAHDLLRTLPSINIANSGGIGKSSALSIRGEEGYRTLVKIDGIEITDVTGPQAASQIQHVMSGDLSRIEVLRGPQGLMYGADAGGVVLLSTQSIDDGIRGGLAYEAGSFDTSRAQANLGVASDKGDIFVSGSRVKTGGINARITDLTNDKDGYENNTSHLRMGWNLTENLRAEVVGRTTHANAKYDGCGWPTTNNCIEEFNQTNSRAAIHYSYSLGDATLAYNHSNMYRDTYEDFTKSLYNYQGETDRWELSGHTRWSDAFTMVYGLETRTDESANDFEEHGITRDQNALYAEYQGRFFDQLFVTLGARQDRTDDFGNFDTHRISAAYIIPSVITGELKIKATSGTGFRLPSLYENATNKQYAGVQLKPETSEGYDLGVEYQWSNRLQMELVYFNQKIEEQITYSNSSWTYVQEVPQSKSKGIEWITSWQLLDSVQLNANITRIIAEDSDGNPRTRKPKLIANLGLDYQISDRWLLGVNYHRTDDRMDIDNAPLDDYELVDLRVRSEFSTFISGFIRIENLFDEEYVEVDGYNTPGHAVYIGVDFKF